MRVVARVDQLHVHPNSPGRALDTSFNHMRNTQSVRDLAKVAFQPALVFHHARSADDFQVGDLGEIGEDFVLHTAGEECVFFVLAEIFKRQDGDRFIDLYAETRGMRKQPCRSGNDHAGCDKHDHVTTTMNSRCERESRAT